MMRVSTTKLVVSTVLFLQLFFGIGYVIRVPQLLPSDERQHLANILDIARTGELHVLSHLDAHYEAIQPPLYYLIGAGVVKVSAGMLNERQQIVCLRLLGLALFMVSTLVLHRSLNKTSYSAKADELTHLAVVTVYGLSPVMLAVSSSVTNDSLSYLMSSCAVLALTTAHCTSWNKGPTAVLGLVLGLALLTKLAFAPSLALIAIDFLIDNRKVTTSRLILLACLLASPTIILLTPWIVWNYEHYHAAFGINMLYGAGTEFYWHPGLISFDRLTAYVLGASFIGYHFLPNEFWNNPQQLALPLKASLILLYSVAVYGAYIILRKSSKKPYSHYVKLYLASLFFWLVQTILYYPEPFRGFLGVYYGFAVSLIVGFMRSFVRHNHYVILLAVVCLIGLNLFAASAFNRFPSMSTF